MFCTKVASRGGTPSYPKARTAEGVHIYAIGDMHGMVELAAGMFDKIDTDIADWSGKVIIIGLGDYIDRGPRSDSVIEFLIQRSRSKRSSLVVLRGNHEDILLRFLDDPEIFGSEWLQLGGEATLSSYGVRVSRIRSSHTAVRDELKRRMPVEHLAFLQALPLTFEHAELFFSHAGARPGVSLVNQDEKDLLWTRWRQSAVEIVFEKILIHGHTPVPEPTVTGGRINVDTGAYATGRLAAVKITPEGVSFLTVT